MAHSAYQNIPYLLIEHKGSLSYSQQNATSSYPEAGKYSQHTKNLFP
jgi:hypothetical protein